MSVSTLASFEYLERLPGTTFRRLYQQPSTALAIFRRMLPHLAKTFVMALLYMSKPLPLTDLDLWVQPESNREKDRCLTLLQRLHIIATTVKGRDAPSTVSLTTNFGSSLRLALTGGGDHQSFGVPSDDSVDGVGIAFLDTLATRQWEGILHFVVNSVGQGRQDGAIGVMDSVKRLLQRGELVTSGMRGGGITKAGFTFLLQEVNAQVWTMLLLLIENAQELGLDSIDVLAFLFMLGSLELGRAYSTTTLTDSQQQMLKYLVDFGLVYIPSQSPNQYYPTRLATTLTSDAGALRSVSAGFDSVLASASGSKGFVIIETNYRLYAYTNSPLQIAVLALFTKFQTRYPNMVSGRVTRDSVANAISHGITSDQIISYLTTHAHPQLVKNSSIKGLPVLPPTVVDQIRLWQIENERMKATPGFLFRDFDSFKEYESCVKYADEIGVLTWKSDVKRMFFVTRHEQLAQFIKSQKPKTKT